MNKLPTDETVAFITGGNDVVTGDHVVVSNKAGHIIYTLKLEGVTALATKPHGKVFAAMGSFGVRVYAFDRTFPIASFDAEEEPILEVDTNNEAFSVTGKFGVKVFSFDSITPHETTQISTE
jgi:hypothetical protein